MCVSDGGRGVKTYSFQGAVIFLTTHLSLKTIFKKTILLLNTTLNYNKKIKICNDNFEITEGTDGEIDYCITKLVTKLPLSNSTFIGNTCPYDSFSKDHYMTCSPNQVKIQ